MSSPLKSVMGCRLPFSNTVNALALEAGHEFAAAFLTVACRTTSRVSARNGALLRVARPDGSGQTSATATFTVRTVLRGPRCQAHLNRCVRGEDDLAPFAQDVRVRSCARRRRHRTRSRPAARSGPRRRRPETRYPMNPPTPRAPTPEPAVFIVPSPSGSAYSCPSRSMDAWSASSANVGAMKRVFEFFERRASFVIQGHAIVGARLNRVERAQQWRRMPGPAPAPARTGTGAVHCDGDRRAGVANVTSPVSLVPSGRMT